MPVWEVPDGGFPVFGPYEVEMGALEEELGAALWPMRDRLGEGDLRGALKDAAVKVNHFVELLDGEVPVRVEGPNLVCSLPEGCGELWREALLWDAATSVVFCFVRALPRPLFDRLWRQTYPRMVEAWTTFAAKLEIEPPIPEYVIHDGGDPVPGS